MKMMIVVTVTLAVSALLLTMSLIGNFDSLKEIFVLLVSLVNLVLQIKTKPSFYAFKGLKSISVDLPVEVQAANKIRCCFMLVLNVSLLITMLGICGLSIVSMVSLALKMLLRSYMDKLTVAVLVLMAVKIVFNSKVIFDVKKTSVLEN